MQSRYVYSQGFLSIWTLVVLVLTLYFQYVRGLEPCPLCMMQRACMVFILLWSIWGIWQKRPYVYWVEGVLSLFGMFLAIRQCWLIFFAPESAICLPGLERLIHYFPWQTVLQAMVWGTESCGVVEAYFLYIPMPLWSLGYFAVSLWWCIYAYRVSRQISGQ